MDQPAREASNERSGDLDSDVLSAAPHLRQPTPAPSKSPPGIIEPANQGFEVLYGKGDIEKLPWHWEGLDPDFAAALKKVGLKLGRVVDIGGGAGTQAQALAQQGFDAWVTDFSAAAMQCAARLAQEKGIAMHCCVDDICHTRLPGSFDAVFDRGCLHIIPPLQRADYLKSLRRITIPGSFLFLKCFSTAEPPRPGPFRFSMEDILNLTGADFECLDSWATEFHGSRTPHPKAILSILRRRT